MNHIWCVKIIDYLHLFNLSGLILNFHSHKVAFHATFAFFNIREFALKEVVSKNLIPSNPSFFLAYHIAPPPLPLSFFMPCLSCCPCGSFPFFPLFFSPSFWCACPTTPLFLSFFMPCLSYCHTHTLFLLCLVASFFMFYLSSHTHTHTFLSFFLLCLSYHTFT